MVDDALLNLGFGIARTAGFIANGFLFGLPVVYLLVLVASLGNRTLEERARGRLARRVSGLVQSALIASAIASFVAIILQAVVLADFGGGTFGMQSMRDVFETSFGRWYLLRFPFLIGLTVLLWGKTRPLAKALGSGRPGARSGFWIAWIVLGLALISTSSFSGHAAVSSPRAAAILNDMVHLMSGSVWFVGIVLLVVILVDLRMLFSQEDRTAFLASLVVRFSTVALVAIGIVALTGTFNSLFNLEHFSDLWTSGYGALLSTKILLFLGVLALGAINHFFVRRRFQKAAASGEPATTTRLFRRTIGVELALALSIFAITGAMAGSARTRPSASSSAQSEISRTV